ncbi:MAG: hypothetical protein U9Q83_09595 [Bacteroidota bacterium]|nr:hypothetical protein [Bacteroidota bacterium]
MEHITYKYIRGNFDIVKEAISIDYRKQLGEINVEFVDGLEIKDLSTIFSKRLEDFPQDAYIQSIPYGYDGGETIEVFQKFNRKETETETIKRLIKMVKEQRKKQAEYEKALKVVEIGIS